MGRSHTGLSWKSVVSIFMVASAVDFVLLVLIMSLTIILLDCFVCFYIILFYFLPSIKNIITRTSLSKRNPLSCSFTVGFVEFRMG